MALDNRQRTRRLHQQLAFLREIDKLKGVRRHNRLLDGSRRENAAEHSWHLALMALVLSDLAPSPGVDLFRVVQMLLIHDIVEIDAGDTFYYSTGDDQKAREQAAAQRLFGLLPPDQARTFRALWEEFEAGQTPEAAFARALDRFQPIYGNYLLEGGTWRDFGVTRADVEHRSGPLVQRGAPELWAFCQELLDTLVHRGALAPGASAVGPGSTGARSGPGTETNSAAPPPPGAAGLPGPSAGRV